MSRATTSRALLAAAAVLAVGALLARSLLAGQQAPAAPAVPIAVTDASNASATDAGERRARALAGLTVTNVSNRVERRSRPGDPWVPVHVGETIALNDSLRTGSGSAALLELRDHTTIWLWPESEVSAERLDDQLARVGVEGGRLDLQVPAREGRRFEVAARGGGATASTQGAQFSIIVDGAHVATVATREGDVEVVSGTGRVRVPPGMQTRARPGQAPEVVSPIPSELLLSVDWPTTTLRAREAVVRGRAPAGVLVSVAGARVVVAPDGTFAQPVALNEGENRVEVTAEDVAGRRVVRRSPPLRVDTRPPAVNTHGRWE